jgi:hypothetical protein
LRLRLVDECRHRVARAGSISGPRCRDSIQSILKFSIEAVLYPSLQIETSNKSNEIAELIGCSFDNDK